MLMRLQEAANYSSPHSNDSDSVTSLDSSHTRHSEDLSNAIVIKENEIQPEYEYL